VSAERTPEASWITKGFAISGKDDPTDVRRSIAICEPGGTFLRSGKFMCSSRIPMPILNAAWFAKMGNPRSIGIVLALNDEDGKPHA
jgi:hypothetical protein